jgi:hypothetical protein
MLRGDWRQGKSGMKIEIRNMSIGHCTSAEACEVGFEQGHERKIFKFSPKKLPDVET